MKALNGFKIIVSICLMVVCASVNAVLISDRKFKELGGDPGQPDVTYKRVFLQLRSMSYQPPYFAVGVMTGIGCTGLWIGNSADGKKSYILTAAHCFGDKVGTFQTTVAFRSYQGVLLAQDGEGYIPEERRQAKTTAEKTVTDIALLKLDRVGFITDQNGKYIPKPVLNDMNDEAYKPTYFVGYGQWGIGSTGARSWWGDPTQGWNRAYGEAESTNFWPSELRILNMVFDRSGGNPRRWAFPLNGDSGASVFQQDGYGRFYAVGEISLTYGGQNTGIPLYRAWKAWIDSKAPGVARWRKLEYSNVKGCYWLNPTSGRWVNVTPFFRDEVKCKAQDGCSKGGGCYKWDVNR